jgi:glycine/D-amino acid oxidase-like deaminating enzyme
MDDVIIIGGSFAGLAAALQLGRARRKIIVLDTGLPRNRFAATRMACSATITSHRWTSWPRRGSSWRVIPRSGWSVPGPTASPAPSMISLSSLAMAKAFGRAA